MRIPKRNFIGGLLTKHLKHGIFVLGPQTHSRINRENKVGRFNSEVQAKLGAKGGAKRSTRKTAACRANGALSQTRKDSVLQTELGLRGAHEWWHVRRGIRSESCPLCKEAEGRHTPSTA
jgi:hypothetical protein